MSFRSLERPESLNLPACMCAEHADTLRMLHDLTVHPKVDKSEMDGGSFVLSLSNLSLMVDVNPTANNVTARLGLESTYSARVSAFMKEVVGRPSQELKVVGGGRGPKAFLDAVFVSRTEAFLDAKCVILDLWEAAEGAGEEAEGGDEGGRGGWREGAHPSQEELRRQEAEEEETKRKVSSAAAPPPPPVLSLIPLLGRPLRVPLTSCVRACCANTDMQSRTHAHTLT